MHMGIHRLPMPQCARTARRRRQTHQPKARLLARARLSARTQALGRLLALLATAAWMHSGRREGCMCSSPECPWPFVHPRSIPSLSLSLFPAQFGPNPWDP